MENNYIKIENIDIWARVGVLKQERFLGQLFSLDVYFWSDFDTCVEQDDINQTIDYSEIISIIRTHAEYFSCCTVEKYSAVLMDLLKERFNMNRIKIVLKKQNPPIVGFNGNISIMRVYEKGSN